MLLGTGGTGDVQSWGHGLSNVEVHSRARSCNVDIAHHFQSCLRMGGHHRQDLLHTAFKELQSYLACNSCGTGTGGRGEVHCQRHERNHT